MVLYVIRLRLPRRQEAANQHQRAEARQGKTHRMWVLSVQTAAANEHLQIPTTIGFAGIRSKESRTGRPCFP